MRAININAHDASLPNSKTELNYKRLSYTRIGRDQFLQAASLVSNVEQKSKKKKKVRNRWIFFSSSHSQRKKIHISPNHLPHAF